MTEKNKNNSILIIDDEPMILDILKRYLEFEFSEVLVAENGKIGLDLAKKHNPSVILTDFNMPKLNGLEFLKSIRESLGHIPVIWMTGCLKEKLQHQAWKYGVFDIIEKPFQFENLISIVKAAKDCAKSDFNLKNDPHIITKLTVYEISLMIDKKTYQDIAKKSNAMGISITTFINDLIERELKKAA